MAKLAQTSFDAEAAVQYGRMVLGAFVSNLMTLSDEHADVFFEPP